MDTEVRPLNPSTMLVEARVREVYSCCPPTLTHYTSDGRKQYEDAWGAWLAAIGVPPAAFKGRRVLDVGCGSCEKAVFYHDWGAQVTGVEMTRPVLDLARVVIGPRTIRLVESSLFEFATTEKFDIVISDGVLHHCADTFSALRRCADHVVEDGILVVGLVNVWGRFWWFKLARAVTRLLAPGDFHRRAAVGQRLFGWTRRGHEGAETDSSAFFRSRQSWAYDWFANPRWNAHGPGQVGRWLDDLGFDHVGSIPSLVRKDAPTTLLGRAIRSISGPGPRLMAWYWLATGRANMFYVAARKRGAALG